MSYVLSVYDKDLSRKKRRITATEAFMEKAENGKNILLVTDLDGKVEKKDRIVVKNDSTFQYDIYTVEGIEENHESDNVIYYQYYAENLLYEMNNFYIEDRRFRDSSAQEVFEAIFKYTPFKFKFENTGLANKRITTSFYHTDCYKAFIETLNAFGYYYEVESSYEINNNIAVIIKEDNKFINNRISWGRNIMNATRRVKEDSIVNVLYPYGNGQEILNEEGQGTGHYGRKIDISKAKKGDGNKYVSDEESIKKYGRHEAVLDFDIDDVDELYEVALQNLDFLKKPRVEYEVSVISNKETDNTRRGTFEVGEKVVVNDPALDLTITAIIKETKLNLLTFEKEVKLGDYQDIGLQNKINSEKTIYKKLRDQVEELASNFKPTEDGAVVSIASVDGLNDILNRLEFKIDENTKTYVNKSEIEKVREEINKRMDTVGGYVYMDEGKGIVTYNKTRDSSPTAVVEIRGGTIRFSNKKDERGEWIFTTAIDGTGINAAAIAAETLTTDILKFGDVTLTQELQRIKNKQAEDIIAIETATRQVSDAVTKLDATDEALDKLRGQVYDNKTAIFHEIDEFKGKVKTDQKNTDKKIQNVTQGILNKIKTTKTDLTGKINDVDTKADNLAQDVENEKIRVTEEFSRTSTTIEDRFNAAVKVNEDSILDLQTRIEAGKIKIQSVENLQTVIDKMQKENGTIGNLLYNGDMAINRAELLEKKRIKVTGATYGFYDIGRNGAKTLRLKAEGNTTAKVQIPLRFQPFKYANDETYSFCFLYKTDTPNTPYVKVAGVDKSLDYQEGYNKASFQFKKPSNDYEDFLTIEVRFITTTEIDLGYFSLEAGNLATSPDIIEKVFESELTSRFLKFKEEYKNDQTAYTSDLNAQQLEFSNKIKNFESTLSAMNLRFEDERNNYQSMLSASELKFTNRADSIVDVLNKEISKNDKFQKDTVTYNSILNSRILELTSKNNKNEENITKISAGMAEFLKPSDLASGGKTVIDGGRIKTGILQSEKGDTWINLKNGEFNFKNDLKYIEKRDNQGYMKKRLVFYGKQISDNAGDRTIVDGGRLEFLRTNSRAYGESKKGGLLINNVGLLIHSDKTLDLRGEKIWGYADKIRFNASDEVSIQSDKNANMEIRGFYDVEIKGGSHSISMNRLMNWINDVSAKTGVSYW